MHTSRPILLSVVIPARDASAWIGELLETVLAQDVEASEVLVVDNGSVDETAEIVRAFSAVDDRVALVRSSARNAAGARNEGVAVATGEYLAFADSDDLVPDGAHRAMLESLQASGSDMAIGDHLKFSPTATWSPTARWSVFHEKRIGARPESVPELVVTRPCWNRMIRRSFWDHNGLYFPDLDSLEDMEPMTRALAAAECVDVLPDHVYLYRDRGDDGSISKRADAAATVRYLEQEVACLSLLRETPPLHDQLVTAVLDADGWAHLSRFLRTAPSGHEIALVRRALDELWEHVPQEQLHRAAGGRRVLWDLMLADRWSEASTFAAWADSADASEQLAAWTAASRALRPTHQGDATDVLPLAEGILRTLINQGEAVPVETVAELLEESPPLPDQIDGTELFLAMREAVRSRNLRIIQQVSALRRVVPLVVHTALADPDGLTIGGPAADEQLVRTLSLVLQSEDAETVVRIGVEGRTWSARLDSAGLAEGRWSVMARAEGVSVDLPVVTARMPLPPLTAAYPTQPLADRRNGWRFIVDKRGRPRKHLSEAFARLARRRR